MEPTETSVESEPSVLVGEPFLRQHKAMVKSPIVASVTVKFALLFLMMVPDLTMQLEKE